MSAPKSVLDILGGKDTAQSLPEGQGVFSNSGFVGQFAAAVMQQFYSTEDITLYDTPFNEGVDFVRRGDVGSYWYYFFDRDSAQAAMEALAVDRTPGRVWRFEMPVDTILNARGNMENWGVAVTSEAKIYSVGYAVKRHEYHLMALPALVDALARLFGMTDSRIWHADELLGEIADEDFTDSLQFMLIGDPEATTDDYEAFAQILEAVNDLELAQKIALGIAEVTPDSVQHLAGRVRIHYKRSRFWTRRAELWAKLGEHDPDKYIPSGYAISDRGKEQETTAESLSTLLRFSVEKWNAMLWGRLHLCKDPRVDAVSKNGNRLSLPLISELFGSQEEAQAACSDSEATATKPAASGSYPEMPAEWGDATDEWLATLKNFKAQYGSETPKMPVLVQLTGQLGCTVDDLKAWWSFA